MHVLPRRNGNSRHCEIGEEGDSRAVYAQISVAHGQALILGRHSYDAIGKTRTRDPRKHLQCPERCLASRIEPADGKSSKWQAHDPETDGRVFICAHCQGQTCVPCDRPEHAGQTCAEYTPVLQASAFRDQDEASVDLVKQMPECTECGKPYELAGGCAYLQCGRCKHRFCGECWAPWTADKGEYALGRLAHEVGCRFRDENPHPDHAYRSDESADVEGDQEIPRPSRQAAKRAADALSAGRLTRAAKRAVQRSRRGIPTM